MLETLALTAGLVMGCGGTSMSQQIPDQRGRRYALEIDTLGVEAKVPASADRVWAVLPAVFADLGLEVNFREPATRRAGACYQRVHGRLAGAPLSTFLDCGDSRSVPNADRFEVAMTVLVTVVPAGDQAAKVHAFVIGVGDDAASSNSKTWCYSTGALEARIRRLVETKLAA